MIASIALAVSATVIGLWALRPPPPAGRRSELLALAPAALAQRLERLHAEVARLEDERDLGRSLFEVAAELVGCVDEADAKSRFAVACRRWWHASSIDLLIEERGRWRALGGGDAAGVPDLDQPVRLAGRDGEDLVLDLSPAVPGRACLVARGARPQPTLAMSAERQRQVAEVLRAQLCLSLRRVALYRRLQELARLDPLTGTQRRWYGESRLEELVEAGSVVAVLFVDIDRFKVVNDTHGHDAGDRVLAAVGRCLVATLRTGDLVTRLGGEEFLAILPDTSLTPAKLVAERLRHAVAQLADLPCPVTVSIGVAGCAQDDHADALIERADGACYAAKRAGRDRVAVAEAPGGSVPRTEARRRGGTAMRQRSPPG